MKTILLTKSSCIRLVFFLPFLFFLVSCQKNKDSDQVNSYLVDYQLVSTIPVSTSVTAMTFLSLKYPEINQLISSMKYDVNVYKVTYKTHYKSNQIIASGLICVPNSDEELPLISFQNGTNTSNTEAPSVNPNNPSFILLQTFAGIGYIILIPDYIGFGASSQYLHPYFVIEPTNNAIIDLMHATEEFVLNSAIHAKLNRHNYLMGYSQGGWATLSAYKQIETEIDTFEIKAASCGAGAYDLLNTSNYIAKQFIFPSPLYLPYYIYSHQQYGLLNDSLGIFFNEPYSLKIPLLFDGLKTSREINSELNDTVDRLLKPELITSLDSGINNQDSYNELKADLEANSVTTWELNGLLHFYHGSIDDNLPVTGSRAIYSDFLELNLKGKVEYFEMEGLNHETGVIPWGIKTLIWFNSLEN
jgi:hypothetical protein